MPSTRANRDDYSSLIIRRECVVSNARFARGCNTLEVIPREIPQGGWEKFRMASAVVTEWNSAKSRPRYRVVDRWSSKHRSAELAGRGGRSSCSLSSVNREIPRQGESRSTRRTLPLWFLAAGEASSDHARSGPASRFKIADQSVSDARVRRWVRVPSTETATTFFSTSTLLSFFHPLNMKSSPRTGKRMSGSMASPLCRLFSRSSACLSAGPISRFAAALVTLPIRWR